MARGFWLLDWAGRFGLGCLGMDCVGLVALDFGTDLGVDFLVLLVGAYGAGESFNYWHALVNFDLIRNQPTRCDHGTQTWLIVAKREVR